LLSRPNPPADFQETAKKELQEELAIDPSNASAEYILGELSRQEGDLDAAIAHFAKASQLDPTFADAFLGLGTSLVTEKKYAEAISPLEVAVKLQPENPAGHYSLATAYTRTGRKADAQREFELHEKTSQKAAPGAPSPQ
jgi:Tfp pilus assembly protein PilF